VCLLLNLFFQFLSLGIRGILDQLINFTSLLKGVDLLSPDMAITIATQTIWISFEYQKRNDQERGYHKYKAHRTEYRPKTDTRKK